MSKALLWASTPYDVLRKRHVDRLRAIHAELAAENERLRLDVARLTAFVIPTARRGSTRACTRSARKSTG